MSVDADELWIERAAPVEKAADHARVVRLHWKRLARAALKPLSVFAPVFVLGTLVTFLLGVMSGLSPAHLQLGESATPAAVARIEHEWGLDRSFIVQYADWLSALAHGDLGRSWYNGREVAGLLVARAGISLAIAGAALTLGVLFGLALGLLSALNQGSWLDRSITAVLTLISVMPAFVVGIALVSVFAVTLQLLPAAGYVPLEDGLWLWLRHLVLPATALSFDTTADVARQLRGGLIGVYNENYVIGARLRGLSERRIFWVHVLPNALGPTLSILGLRFSHLLGGAVVTEAVFGLSGYGKFAGESALRGDVPAVQGILVVLVVVVVSFNLLVNLTLNRIMPSAERGA